LLLATWNIREFDSAKFGWRTVEPYFYIAEILSHFDLIAVQESGIASTPCGRSKTTGNAERIAFIYDRRKVDFTGLAAELVLLKKPEAAGEPRQLARSPYVASFRAGWAYLSLVTVHIITAPRRLMIRAVSRRSIASQTSSPTTPRSFPALRNRLSRL
jgi:hypothetical protein